jgi:hypothetical protein
MEDVPERHYTAVHATPLGTRYVLLSDIPNRLRDNCEQFARGRRALLLLQDGSTAVFYEDWVLWADSIDVDSNPTPVASGGVARAEGVRPRAPVPQFRCDRCGAAAQYSADDGLTDLLQLSFEGGIGSALGARRRFDLNICHGCLKETLGPWFRVAPIG